MSWRRMRLTEIGWDTPLSLNTEVELPQPVADQVRVRVAACGVCGRDCVDREGRFPYLNLPLTPGHEAAGVVEATGPDVTAWKVGDRVATLHRDHCGTCARCQSGEPSLCEGAFWVFGLMADGGYSSHLLGRERCFYAAPQDMDLGEASVLHCTYGTAWRALLPIRNGGAGARVLVTGANGGVGAAAVELASRLDATVVAVVRDEAHKAFLERRGAHEVVVDGGSEFHRKLGAGKVDLAVDCVGEPTFNAALRSVRPGGVLAVVGNLVERRAGVNLGYLIVHGLQIVARGGATADDMAQVALLHQDRPLAVPIAGRLPLEQADAAQRRVKEGGLQGRLVLVPDL